MRMTVIAWLWARTVKSPNPAFADVEVPLATTFVLSSKEGKKAYVQPVIEGGNYRFTVRLGEPPEAAKNGTKLSRGANFQCVMSDTPIEPEHIYAEANAGRMGARLVAQFGLLRENSQSQGMEDARAKMWKLSLARDRNPTLSAAMVVGMPLLDSVTLSDRVKERFVANVGDLTREAKKHAVDLRTAQTVADAATCVIELA